MLALLLLAAATPAPFTLEPVKPGVFKLVSVEDQAARMVLTVSPWPPPATNVPAEVGLSCQADVISRVLAVLDKHADKPRSAAPAVTLDGPAAFAGRLEGKILAIGAGKLTLDEKNAQALFENLDAPGVRMIEATLRGAPKRNVPQAKLQDSKRIAPPGAVVLWSGARGVLFTEGKAVKLYELNGARVLGQRTPKPGAVAACGANPGAPCALFDGVLTVFDAKLETLPPPTAVKQLWVSPNGQWIGTSLQSDDQQILWFWDRKVKKAVSWVGPGDTSHELRFTAWGSKGVLFARTAPCIDTEAETVNDVACLLELETGRLSSVGNARDGARPITAPDRAHRLAWVSSLPVIEATDGGEPVRIDAAISPAWVSSTAVLVAADPLTTVDLAGNPRRLIEDRVQFAGGPIEGARVWYLLSDGLYVGRVTGL